MVKRRTRRVSRGGNKSRKTTKKTTVRPRSPIVTRSVSKRMSTLKKRTPKLRMKSYVYITGAENSGYAYRVGQLVAESRNGLNVAVRINYNGYLLILKKSHIRIATPEEKKRDPKAHRREPTLSASERERLNYL